MDFVPLDRSLFRRSLAESLCALLSQRYNSAKQIARGIGIEPVTAENLKRGKLSVGTLEKALLAEGRDLWNKLGDEIFGESFYEFEERRIQGAIREAEGAHANLVRLRAQGAAVLASAPRLDEAVARPTTVPAGRSPSNPRREADGGSLGGTPRSRDRGAR
jgi:hypothetical protein